MATTVVFVIGAGGYIGEGVARAFRREGFIVYGLIRRPEQAKILRQFEVTPVLGDATKPETWKSYVEKAQIIVDATDLPGDHEQVAREVYKIIDALPVDPIFPPKTFIYTSGIMVYGHDERIRDESAPTGTNSDYAKWRAAAERFVLQAKTAVPIVIRPGWVFGGRIPHGQRLFDNKDKIVIRGENRDRRYSWIHIEDLGDFYVLAARQGARIRGEVFNAVGYDTPKWADIVKKGSSLAGFKGEIEWAPNETDPHRLADSTVILNPQKGIELLGFKPKHFGFLENLELYYDTYKSYRD